MKTVLVVLRWVAFIPGGILIGTLASFAGTWGTLWFPEFIQNAACGGFGAVGTIAGGLYIAPKPHPLVKWTMILLCLAIGALSILGGMITPDDKSKGLVTGISVILFSLCYCGIPTRELTHSDAP